MSVGQTAQWIWSSPLSEIRTVGCLWDRLRSGSGRVH
jgi:hypothetical protein